MSIETKSQVPLLVPVSKIIPAGEKEIISFPNLYFGIAVSIIITNLDAGNNATYKINGESNPLLTLSPSNFRTFDDTLINLLEVQAGEGGAVQVEAQVQKVQ